MLNEDYKQTAVHELIQANDKYMQVFRQAIKDMERLQQSRKRSVLTLQRIDSYIYILAGKPREIETTIGQIKVRYTEFGNRIDTLQRHAQGDQVDDRVNTGLGVGTLVGVGGATLAPSAAMAVAMTFGTASTGVAISSLSGVAATNAALSWLGGGTIAAGGAGVIGGKALLDLAGPIGWVIGAGSIATGMLLKAIKNNDIAKKAEESTRTIIRETTRIKKISAQVNAWNKETVQLTNQLAKKLAFFRTKKNYELFSQQEKIEMISFMNMAETLSKKLQETIT